MRVLLTGSRGRVASLLIPRLRGRYELTLVDARSGEPKPNQWPEQTALSAEDHREIDICDTDSIVKALAGIDAIVHLAGNASAAGWEDLRQPNVEGVVSMFEAARQAGTSKFVFASTNHVTGKYDRDRNWSLRTGQPVRPDSLYAVTKVFGEALGRFYSEVHGISVICLRLGGVLPRPDIEPARISWLSPDDLGRLVEGALRSDVTFGIYYGVSANTRRRWCIENARIELGYQPQDNAEDHFT